ncbi:hypothetical protein F4803DRAFT_548505 [Xylaria telfairii]|nr:hypothetical protein F4803DRAFT_548505 [Xylaria telfairii]
MAPSIAPRDVYTGMWIDWSKSNQVLGSTITLTSSSSRLLAAFLTLYVSLSVSYLWLLLVYSMHRTRYSITSGKCRAIVRQQQALLKAGLTPTSTGIRLIKLYWAYRFTPFAWQQSWIWIAISALSAVSSIAAGLFSSHIIDSSPYINVLLANSPNCGLLYLPGILGTQLGEPRRMAIAQYTSTLLDMGIIYARDCYNSSSDKSQCNFFSSSTIPWETEWEAKCPFEDMCIGPAIRLDTGTLNSNSVFGINSPTEDQIEFRKITTCAPIRQKGYTENVVADPELFSRTVQYFYGPTRGRNATKILDTKSANVTWAYTMTSLIYGGHSPRFQDWLPINAMNNNQGDGTITFLSSNSVAFRNPCDDPVFAAHAPISLATYDGTAYLQDNLAGVLGCLEQYQMCSPASNTCSIVGGIDDVLQVINKMPLTPIQVSTANVTANALDFFGGMFSVTNATRSPILAATQRLVDGIQLPLPSNQWQIEVQLWHSIVMSMIQYRLLEYTIGPNNEDLQKYVPTPPTPERQALCKRQRVHTSQGFANVSSLGLFLTISLGTVVILLALFLDNIMGCMTRLLKGDGKKHRAWVRDDVLHLQRLAYRQEQVFGPRWIATGDNIIPLVEGNGFLDPIVDPQELKTDNTQSRLSLDSLIEIP